MELHSTYNDVSRCGPCYKAVSATFGQRLGDNGLLFLQHLVTLPKMSLIEHTLDLRQYTKQLLALFFKRNGPLFFYFRLFNTMQLTVNKYSMKICQCLDSNRGPLLSETTALPTETQPLPWFYSLLIDHVTFPTEFLSQFSTDDEGFLHPIRKWFMQNSNYLLIEVGHKNPEFH